MDAIDLMKKKKNVQDTLFYLDPPYYGTGKMLYTHFYKNKDHIALADYINSLKKHNWILSYDFHEEIGKLYENKEKKIVMKKSHSANGKIQKEYFFHSENLFIPEVTSNIPIILNHN